MIIRLENNPKIVVRADQYPITVTGATTYNFVGSGDTTVTQSGGNPDTVTIYTIATGATVSWGNILGTLSGQTDLQTALDLKLDISDYETYTGTTQTTIEGLENSITGNTAAIATNTSDISTISAATSGISSTYVPLVAHNAGTTATFEKGSYYQRISNQDDTTLEKAVLQLSTYGADFGIYSGVSTSIGGRVYLDTSRVWITYAKEGSNVANLYLRDGYMTADVPFKYTSEMSGHTNYDDLSFLTKSYADALYATTADLSDKLDTSVFNTYTGDTSTLIATKLNIADQYITGTTASGGTILDLTDGVLTIYSPTGGTSGDYVTNTVFDTYTGTTAPATYAGLTPFNAHTGDSTIHYTQASISIAQSQVQDLSTDLSTLNDAITGNTANINTNLGYIQTLTGETSTNANNIAANTTGITANYELITGNTTNIATNAAAITGKTDTSLFETYTGATETALDAKADLSVTRIATGGDYTGITSNNNRVIEFTSASDYTFTVPSGLTSGWQCTVVKYGSGDVTIAAGSGVTLRSKDSNLKITDQYAAASIYQRSDTNEFLVIGDLTA